MILTPKMVTVLHSALSDYMASTGLECRVMYADRLAAIVETVLELAEDVPETMAHTPITSRLPAVEVVPLVNTSEPQTENQTEAKATELNLHQKIIKMRLDGMMVGEIAKKLDVSIQTVCDHLDFHRKQEAK